MAQPSKKLVTGLAVAVALVVVGYLVFGSQVREAARDVTGGLDMATTTTTTAGAITSITIEPARQDGPWLMYKKGAVVKVVGQNLSQVTIKAMPTGTGAGEEYPDGQIVGEAISLSSQVDTWALPLPESISATNLWAEAKTLDGQMLRSGDLGNVGYEE